MTLPSVVPRFWDCTGKPFSPTTPYSWPLGPKAMCPPLWLEAAPVLNRTSIVRPPPWAGLMRTIWFFVTWETVRVAYAYTHGFVGYCGDTARPSSPCSPVVATCEIVKKCVSDESAGSKILISPVKRSP